MQHCCCPTRLLPQNYQNHLLLRRRKLGPAAAQKDGTGGRSVCAWTGCTGVVTSGGGRRAGGGGGCMRLLGAGCWARRGSADAAAAAALAFAAVK